MTTTLMWVRLSFQQQQFNSADEYEFEQSDDTENPNSIQYCNFYQISVLFVFPVSLLM